MNGKTWIGFTLMSCATLAVFAANGAEKKDPFYYRTALVANARANAVKYGWAREIFEKKTGDARRWLGWTDERVLHYVPEVTPVRPCDCPTQCIYGAIRLAKTACIKMI